MRHFIILLSAIPASACSQANATSIDSKNDIHCATLASGFRIAAQQQGTPQHQVFAVIVIDEWYGAKMVQLSKAPGGRDRVMAEAEPIAKVLDADFEATKAPYTSCMERAVADPFFNSFVARLSGR